MTKKELVRPLHKFNPEIWLMLREIKRERDLSESNVFIFKWRQNPQTISTADTAIPSLDRQEKILQLLSKSKILKFRSLSSSAGFELTLFDEIFEKFLKQYERKGTLESQLNEPAQIELQSYSNSIIGGLFNGAQRKIALGTSHKQRIFDVLWANLDHLSEHRNLENKVNHNKQSVITAINELRQQLGDNQTKGIIESVHGKGYMLKKRNF